MEPNPTEVSPWYLRNITQALALDEATGNVYVRTGFTGNIVITGNVVIPADISSNINAVGTSGNLTTPYLPIDGNVVVTSGDISVADGNIAITGGNINVDNFPTGFSVTQNIGSNPWTVDGNVNAVITNSPTVNFGGINIDAFGRLRVSEPYTLFDSQARYYDHEQFSSLIAGTANVVYQSNSSSFELNVGSNANDSVIRETVNVFPYQPGKSMYTMITGCMNTPKTGLRQRMGLFGANNGIFFENNAGTNYMVIRSSSSGSIVEDRIPQSQWNGDRLDGSNGPNNPSGLTLNPALVQIFWTDLEWLGVGTVRTGFVINGTFYVCHYFNHANTPSTGTANNTTTYMTTATLPIRYEITNVGGTTGSSMFRQICSTVISEGGYNQTGPVYSATTGFSTPKTLATKGVYYPLISVRLASTRLDALVNIFRINLIGHDANAHFQFTMFINPTLTGATWAGTSATGTVQYDTGATAISGGLATGGALLHGGEAYESNLLESEKYPPLGRYLDGTAQIVTLAVMSDTDNAQIVGQLTWEELT